MDTTVFPTTNEMVAEMQKIIDVTVKKHKKDFEYDECWIRECADNNKYISFLWTVREGGTHIIEFLTGGGPDYCKSLNLFQYDMPNTGEKYYFITIVGSHGGIIRKMNSEEVDRKISKFLDFLYV